VSQKTLKDKMTRRRFLKWFGIAPLTAMLGGSFWAKTPHKANPYYTGPVTDHFNGQTFHNPDGVKPGNFTDLLKWQYKETKAKWPEHYPSDYTGTKPAPNVTGNKLHVTMIGHATMLIQTGGLNIITDPVLSERASPVQFFGPKRHNPPGVAFDDLPKIDLILLSHNHYDHLDILTLEKLVQRDAPLIITPLGNDTIIHKAIKGANIKTGDWGDMISISSQIKIHVEPCHHWSARGTKDRRMALWAAFVIETDTLKIYHIGDTGYHSGTNYKAVAEKHNSFDLAILPVGAYEPRWFMKGQHQNPYEAVEGFKLCNAKTAIGHHWGTFQLTNEAIDAPPKALAKALKDTGILPERFSALSPGQVWIMQNPS
jgi:L-ascorbate metabolism protein UlaG (beta-lactamase superfamily)